jgi:NtrC-family two-component system response regulator AlgB
MRRACDLVERVAATDSPVLIRGEHGTGKGLIAQTIHVYSKRKAKRFLPVALAQIPEVQMTSDLFGTAKGTLGDGLPARDGALRQANGGVLVLDEIEHLSPAAQARLIHFLNTREVLPEGADAGQPADVRIIATVVASLEQLVAQGRFRQDLLQRLTPITIVVPPLRERREDILPLVSDFLRLEAGPGHESPDVLPEVQRALKNYDWPRNVTELEEVVSLACRTLDAGRITLQSLPEAVAAAAGLATTPVREAPPRGTALKEFLLDSLKQSKRAAAGHPAEDSGTR